MVTRRQYESFETRISRVSGEMAECLEYAKPGCTDAEYDRLMEASKRWIDEVREIRKAVNDRMIADLSKR